ncbi:hypothetical protein [Cohnella sp. REN36]|uniref:hypothetical protein n=1 Tax=Cohnella sp. REN36 TaxID=2887347 RepID=UPI001D15241A|nr:hypothetical protein [Cohnella sp. REN36]MCC3372631.1 hypothetical protein [Cohnella sp. REN36]
MSENGFRLRVANKEGQLGFMDARGGLREGAGRKGIGTTKKVSMTLADELWARLDSYSAEHGLSRSEALRRILESHFSR